MGQKVVFQYSNIIKPTFAIKVFEDDKQIHNGVMEFDQNTLVDDLPTIDSLSTGVNEYLSAKDISRDNALFLINSKDFIKLTTVVPNINERKTKKFYETELADKLPDIDKYYRVSNDFSSKNERIYYDYLLDNKYISFFKELGERLQFTNCVVDTTCNYLFKKVTNEFSDDTFAYFYDEKGLGSLLLVINKTLCSYTTFESSTGNYRLYGSSIIDKHMNEFEKVKVEKVIANKDIICLKELGLDVVAYSVGN